MLDMYLVGTQSYSFYTNQNANIEGRSVLWQTSATYLQAVHSRRTLIINSSSLFKSIYFRLSLVVVHLSSFFPASLNPLHKLA